jgi:hypothetical protein
MTRDRTISRSSSALAYADLATMILSPRALVNKVYALVSGMALLRSIPIYNSGCIMRMIAQDRAGGRLLCPVQPAGIGERYGAPGSKAPVRPTDVGQNRPESVYVAPACPPWFRSLTSKCVGVTDS